MKRLYILWSLVGVPFCLLFILYFLPSCSSRSEPRDQPETPTAEKDDSTPLVKAGQLVRHRIDGRIGVVLENQKGRGFGLNVKFPVHKKYDGFYPYFDDNYKPEELEFLTEEQEKDFPWKKEVKKDLPKADDI